jgi:replicative DNA helicase
MTTPQIEAQEAQHYLDLLFPDPPPDTWLVVSWLVAPHDFRSQWFRMAQVGGAARFIVQQAQQCDIYVGLGLRHPQCVPQGRGSCEDVYVIGGLWFEADHNGGVHSAQNLPTPGQLNLFIEGLPFQCSLLIDSTGGNHGYLLFKEHWILDTPEEHQKAALLLRRFQRTIQAQAAAHGWKVDSTADLARVLRPAGTLNYKSGAPKSVTILHEDGIRYNPSDIADAPWLATIEDMYTPSASNSAFPATRLEPIVNGCAWLRHCRDDAATLPEPEWYAMLGIIGRCMDGEQIAHEWSALYPRYSKDETARKLQHALADAGPRTCSTIRYDLGADVHCRDCQHWRKVKSPLVLGMPLPPKMIVSHGTSNGTTSHGARNTAGQAQPASTPPSVWEPPTPFDEDQFPVFPVEALPSWLAEYVRALAHATQTPIDLASLLGLAAVATAMAQKVRVEVRQGYSEPVNVFVVVAMPPGSRKSPVFEEVMRPIQRYEEALMRQAAADIVKAEARYNIAKGELQQLQGKASKEETAVERMRLTEDAETLAAKLLTLLPPEKPRLVTDDTTPERLASLLAAQQGRMAVLSPEGGDVFAAMSGRYTAHKGKQSVQNANLGVYLKGHSGDTMRVDRVGRPDEYVQQPALTVALTVQPSVLQGLRHHGEFRERGLLGRFLYALPPVLLGHRQTRVTPVPRVVSQNYHTTLTALLSLPLATGDDGLPTPKILCLTPEASALFEDFEASVEPMLAQFGALGHMTDWGGKYVGHVARIMGLLHCALTPIAPWETPIAPTTVRCAIQIGRYAMAHTRAAYGMMGRDGALEDAKHLLAWLRREERQSISKRDLHQGTKTRFSHIGMMEPAVQLLMEHGFLVLQAPSTQTGKAGRPAGPCYDINPHLYTHNPYAQNPQNPQKGEPGGGFEGYEDFEIQQTALTGCHSQPTRATPTTSLPSSYATNGIHPASRDDDKEIAGDFDEVTI